MKENNFDLCIIRETSKLLFTLVTTYALAC